MRSEFLRFVASPNVSLRFIIICHKFKYTFGIKITLLQSLRNQKKPLKARFRHNLSKGLSFTRIDFLGLVGAQNESLRIIIIKYMLKYLCRIKTTFLESLQSQKNPFKGFN